MTQPETIVALADLVGVRAFLARDFGATVVRNLDCRRALRAEWGKPDEIRKLADDSCALLWRIKHKGRMFVVCAHPRNGTSYAVQDARGTLGATRDPELGKAAIAFLKTVDQAVARHDPALAAA